MLSFEDLDYSYPPLWSIRHYQQIDQISLQALYTCKLRDTFLYYPNSFIGISTKVRYLTTSCGVISDTMIVWIILPNRIGVTRLAIVVKSSVTSGLVLHVTRPSSVRNSHNRSPFKEQKSFYNPLTNEIKCVIV